MTHEEYMKLSRERDMAAYRIVGCAQAILAMSKAYNVDLPGDISLKAYLEEYEAINRKMSPAE